MQYQTPYGTPGWNDGGEERLFVSMLLATAMVAIGLMLLRLPVIPGIPPIVELFVRVVQQPAEQPRVEERPPDVAPVEEFQPSPDERISSSAPPAVAEPAPSAGSSMDLDTARQQSIDEYIESQREDWGYFNPDLTDKRRELSGRYRPPTHPPERPVWENAEVDTIGRTVLRSGNCFKVLDDPNVTRRDQFETFDQYIAQCTFQRRLPQELPWVAIIREQYEYLRNPAGYVRGEREDSAQ